MPHITVEYCESLEPSVDVPKMLGALHARLGEIESITLAGIKTRAIPVKYIIVGDGSGVNKMLHITVRLLPGRSDDLKKQMSEAMAKIARKFVHDDDRISVTVEVVDMHAESYIK